MIEFDGLTLPDKCPACEAAAEREHRFYAVGRKPSQFTVEYPCGTIITTLYTPDGSERMTNVSAGCRDTTLKRLTNE